jgi:glycogen debranching enzyme
VLNYNLVLKSGELFTAGDIETDGSRERATGLYYRDTRHLSAFEVTIDGTMPEVLSIDAHNPAHATVICTNRLIQREAGDVFPQKILVVQTVSLGDALDVELSVQNFDHLPLAFELGVLLAADFRDLFDIRGFHRDRRGRWTRPKAGARGIELGYVGLDGKRTGTKVEYDQDCTVTPSTSAAEIRDGSFLYLMNTEHGHMVHEIHEVPAANLRFDLELQPHERWAVHFVVTPQTASEWPEMPDLAGSRVTLTTSDNSKFNDVLTQCRLDLDSLQTTFPHGSLPAAGIPWFVAPFGRDSLITSLQTLHIAPDRAIATIRTLAALQGTRVDPEREEQPGKILHEMRYGEMARIGEVPHSPYYGSVDATPLWLWLVAECVIWTGQAALIDELIPNIRAAIDWIDRYGDLDGDGLVEYRTDSEGVGHITHQVWKDSFDSLNHTDGTPALGPVAGVEVQGYVYAAYDRLARAASGHKELAADLCRRAERIRALIEEKFWLESEGLYAQALDGQKRAVETPSSNPGHLLACSVPSPERAARMAHRFEQADFNSGWGIRTLSASAASYNPMSYHNGSIWPHDNSLIGYGLYRYGETATGHLVSTSLYDAAATMPMHRLPELYCGFPRLGMALDAPIDYPVSCSPQAWAAGALPYLVRGMLGLEVDPETRELVVDPAFPVWVNAITIHRLCVLGQEGTLTAYRTGEGYEVEATGLRVLRVE